MMNKITYSSVLSLYNVVLLNMWHYMLWHTEKNSYMKVHSYSHAHTPAYHTAFS